jgi:riboflavin biosynthesis pyrimidine reductase
MDLDRSRALEKADLSELYAYPSTQPWLRANMIGSLDGAAWWDNRTGQLGNEADRRLFQLLRGLADVVIVGAGTVRIENYGPVTAGPGWDSLRAGRPPVPPLAVVSRGLDLDFDAPIFTAARERTILLTTQAAPASRRKAAESRADVIVAGRDSINFRTAVTELTARGHSRLLCEGGPRVLAQITAAELLDELCLTLSPVMLAGDPARILNGPRLPDPERFRLAHVHRDQDYLFLRYVSPRR